MFLNLSRGFIRDSLRPLRLRGKTIVFRRVSPVADSAFDLEQHLRIVGELLEEEQQALHRLGGPVAGKAAADEVDLLQLVSVVI